MPFHFNFEYLIQYLMDARDPKKNKDVYDIWGKKCETLFWMNSKHRNKLYSNSAVDIPKLEKSMIMN